MDTLQIAVALSALLCSLVAGLVLTFALVVMPGIRTMGELDYLRSFKAMDGVIQKGPPVFMLIWLGSAVVLLAATVLGVRQLEGMERILLVVACAIYILGVHVPTAAINIPLNNFLQGCDLEALTEGEVREIQSRHESRWEPWNWIRTVVAIVTTVLLLYLLTRI
jgi:uncharacterized membrane protein